MTELTVGKNDAGKRLDAFLLKVFPTMPGSLLYKYIRTKKIKVNRKRTELNYRLAEGDTLQCFISEEFTNPPKKEELFKTLSGNIEIVYEDENIILAHHKAILGDSPRSSHDLYFSAKLRSAAVEP